MGRLSSTSHGRDGVGRGDGGVEVKPSAGCGDVIPDARGTMGCAGKIRSKHLFRRNRRPPTSRSCSWSAEILHETIGANIDPAVEFLVNQRFLRDDPIAGQL